MSYQDPLSSWTIYRRLPNLQRRLVTRFHRRHQAEECLKAIQRLQPELMFEIVYEFVQDAAIAFDSESANFQHKIKDYCSWDGESDADIDHGWHPLHWSLPDQNFG